MITVLIAERLTLLREGIAAILRTEINIQVIGSAVTVEETILLSRIHREDVLLLGTDMAMSWCNIERVIKQESPYTKILCFASGNQNMMNFPITNNGEVQLSDDVCLVDLLKAIYQLVFENAIRPQYYFPYLHRSGINSRYGLNCEEEMVLMLLMQGASNKSIIKRMFMSESSVKKCLTNIYRKLAVKNRTQAVLKGLKENDITYKKQIGKL